MPSLVHKESFDSVTVFWLDRDAAVAAVTEAATRLVATCPEVEQVVLFGSLADGRAVPGSDADILVLTESDLPWLERNARYRTFFDLEMGVDVFAYRRDELNQAPVARSALATGIDVARRK